ncbi:DUF4238 domain-containing protein [Aequorivita viscosa]|nr:DUF4238 domain-containing protein [Aequorivita viscosa]
MANKKRQHFISQFLLRNFSQKSNNKVIHLHNKKTNKTVENAPIKSQAQESYFYGIDTAFEDFLSHSECKASEAIKNIISEEKLPEQKTKANSFLLHFVMMYAFRTKASIHNTEERINSAFKKVAKYDKELSKIDLSTNRIVHPEPAAFNLAYNMDNWVVTSDLSLVLLKNRTEKDFIISDNPFVQFNPIHLAKKSYPNNGGLLSKGLIIFFPIHPKFCLMFYDSWAYDTINMKARKVEIESIDDINYINLLQAISADKILYFGQIEQLENIKALSKESIFHKKNTYINETIRDASKPNKVLLLSYYLEHLFNPDFSFFKLTSNAEKRKPNIGMDDYRNEEIVEWVKMDKSHLWKSKRT